MKRLLIFLAFSLFTVIMQAFAMDKCDKFVISGYRVVIIPSGNYKVKVCHPEWCRQHISEKTLYVELADANGRMPKDTVFIYTNRLRKIELNFSTLEVDEMFYADSLQILLAAGTTGRAVIKADRLKVDIGGGSRLQLSGEIDCLSGKVVGNSRLDADNLKVLQTSLNVKDHSSAIVHTSPIPELQEKPRYLFMILVWGAVILGVALLVYRKCKKRKAFIEEKKDYSCWMDEFSTFKKTDWYQMLLTREPEIGSEYIPIDEQLKLFECINNNFVAFKSDMKSLYPSMNNEELIFCILAALKFRTKTTAYCLRTTVGALRTRKNRLKNHLSEEIFTLLFV